MQFVILAGGEGSRFVKEGVICPKPMVPLCGRPMIGALIDMLIDSGADRIRIGANSRMLPLLDYLDRLRDTGMPLEVRPVNTDNSYMTLKEASEGLAGRFIAITCDAIFPADEFQRYVQEAVSVPEDSAVMGLTRFVEDESPLYARLSEDGEVIDYRYGGVSFGGDPIVSAGIYGLSDEIMVTISESGPEPASLSDFQRILAAETPLRVLPYEFSIAFDVDDSHDLRQAEDYLSGRMCRK